jgi:3,4-dihydroxy 2-butanone 4-phosphate synthase/GTP cyclohydrolase II
MGGVGDCDDNGDVLVQEDPVLVRMHRRDLLGDIFRVPRDAGKRASGDELHAALRAISTAGRGVVVYLRTESGMGELSARLQRIQRRETDDVNAPDLTRDDSIAGRTHPMDRRELGIGSQILRDLGIRTIRLLSNSPARSMPGLSAFDLEIVEQLAFEE